MTAAELGLRRREQPAPSTPGSLELAHRTLISPIFYPSFFKCCNINTYQNNSTPYVNELAAPKQKHRETAALPAVLSEPAGVCGVCECV